MPKNLRNNQDLASVTSETFSSRNMAKGNLIDHCMNKRNDKKLATMQNFHKSIDQSVEGPDGVGGREGIPPLMTTRLPIRTETEHRRRKTGGDSNTINQ